MLSRVTILTLLLWLDSVRQSYVQAAFFTVELVSPNGAYHTISTELELDGSKYKQTLRVNTGASNFWAKGPSCVYGDGTSCTDDNSFPTPETPAGPTNFVGACANGTIYNVTNMKFQTPSTLAPGPPLVGMPLGSANSVASAFVKFDVDGEIGLDRGIAVDGKRQNAFIEQLAKNSDTGHPPKKFGKEITLHLKSAYKPSDKDKDRLTFGGADRRYCNSGPHDPFITLTAENSRFWVFTTSKVKIHGNPVSKDAASVLVSNGHEFLEVPEAIYNDSKIEKLYPPNTKLKCNEVVKTKGFQFTVKDTVDKKAKTITIATKDLLYQYGTGENDCYWAVKSTPGKAWKLGNPLYRAYCVRHDYLNGKLEFYEPKAHQTKFSSFELNKSDPKNNGRSEKTKPNSHDKPIVEFTTIETESATSE